MSNRVESDQKTPCILEISDKGIKMVDKSKPGVSFSNHMHQNAIDCDVLFVSKQNYCN